MPSSLRRPLPRLLAALLLAGTAALALLWTASSSAQSEGGLQSSIAGKKAQERTLGSALARLGALERRTAKEVSILQGRLAEAQTALAKAQSQLERTRTDLRAAQARALKLRERLAVAQASLADLMRARYETDPPDLVTVVLHADGFSTLLDQLGFAKRIQDRDAEVLRTVRSARTDALEERRELVGLEADQAEEAQELEARRDQMAQLEQAVAARQAALQQARTARQQALDAVRSSRQADERSLSKLRARQAREALARLEQARAASVSQVGPGGPWAIPWAVVQCESGGQNLHPNFASASGYYQFLDSTWRGLGGSTPHAYQASKAEQDRLAAQLWAGGKGASNWVCAYLVGLVD